MQNIPGSVLIQLLQRISASGKTGLKQIYYIIQKVYKSKLLSKLCDQFKHKDFTKKLLRSPLTLRLLRQIQQMIKNSTKQLIKSHMSITNNNPAKIKLESSCQPLLLYPSQFPSAPNQTNIFAHPQMNYLKMAYRCSRRKKLVKLLQQSQLFSQQINSKKEQKQLQANKVMYIPRFKQRDKQKYSPPKVYRSNQKQKSSKKNIEQIKLKDEDNKSRNQSDTKSNNKIKSRNHKSNKDTIQKGCVSPQRNSSTNNNINHINYIRQNNSKSSYQIYKEKQRMEKQKLQKQDDHTLIKSQALLLKKQYEKNKQKFQQLKQKNQEKKYYHVQFHPTFKAKQRSTRSVINKDQKLLMDTNSNLQDEIDYQLLLRNQSKNKSKNKYRVSLPNEHSNDRAKNPKLGVLSSVRSMIHYREQYQIMQENKKKQNAKQIRQIQTQCSPRRRGGKINIHCLSRKNSVDIDEGAGCFTNHDNRFKIRTKFNNSNGNNSNSMFIGVCRPWSPTNLQQSVDLSYLQQN